MPPLTRSSKYDSKNPSGSQSPIAAAFEEFGVVVEALRCPRVPVDAFGRVEQIRDNRGEPVTVHRGHEADLHVTGVAAELDAARILEVFGDDHRADLELVVHHRDVHTSRVEPIRLDVARQALLD